MTTQSAFYHRVYRLKRLASLPPGTCTGCYKMPAAPGKRRCDGCRAKIGTKP